MAVNIKRLTVELETIGKVYDVEIVGDNLKHWQIALPGPDATPFFGFTFLIEIIFPSQYPFAAPTVMFKTIIYHPNISKKGEICLSLLAEWKPRNTVMEIMTSLVNLLSSPDPANPLEPQIAAQYIFNKQEYETQARILAKKHAI